MQLKALSYLREVVEAGSFARAAMQVGLSSSNLTRQISSLGLYAQTLENSVRQFAITFLGLIGSNP